MNDAVQATNLSKKFGKVVALDDVTFSVRRGEIFGYLGPNGAGKTTTLRILLGLLKPISGAVNVLGFDPQVDAFEFRKRIAALLENPGIYEDSTVDDNLRLYAEIYRVENVPFKIDHVLDLIGLKDRRRELARCLSKGMKQKLAIGRLLMHDPDLFFFDEPTAGLDPLFQREVRDMIRKLAHEGKTVFLSSHNLHEVQELCTSVAILREGRLVAFDTVEGLLGKSHWTKKEILFKSNHDMKRGAQLLARRGFIKESPGGKRLEIVIDGQNAHPDLQTFLAKQGVFPERFDDGTITLDDMFIVLMNR